MSKRWVLDSGRVSDIVRSKALLEELLEFHWRYYSELAFQRNRIREQLKTSLRENALPFEFSKWQRIVKYKYSLEPLSTKGSLIDPGGRFNVGEIDPLRYPVFPALYLASDKSTGLAEVLGRGEAIGGLTPEELALTRQDSVSAVSVSGKLESVIDIRDRKRLAGFVSLIKNFTLSKSLIKKAQKLNVPVGLIQTAKMLGEALEQRDWRNWPMRFEVPATSQIFGGLVKNAGIEGIVYNSCLTQKACIAVFPETFCNSSAYVELDDPAPTENVPRRIDSSNFRNFF